MTGFLRVKGTKIVDSNDDPIILKGAAIGGHLNMENFITGYPGHETQHKKILKDKIGQEKFDYFFDKFYEYFWTDEDAHFYKTELKFNTLRIPFNYRHFIDDEDDPFKINVKGFAKLDAIINSCSKYQIYTILDLHAAPGGQNQDWHSDSSVHKSIFWNFKIFQDIIVNLWVEIAKYYKDNQYVIGYNPLNEPAVKDHSKLVKYYERLSDEIRKVDPNHILFLDGNTYAMDFRAFDNILPNSVYSIHDYSKFGFPGSNYSGTKEENDKISSQYRRKIEFQIKHQVPVWNGEFGPVYASEFRGDINPDKINKSRYQVLQKQLEVYKTGDPSGDNSPIGWSIWLYKDIGFQGLTYVDPINSKFYKIFNKWLLKKKSLGLDRWGNDIDPSYAKIYENLIDHFKSNIPEKYHRAIYPYNWTFKDHIARVTRDILFSEYSAHEYADLFVGLSFEELNELAASFKFENVLQRKELNKILSEY
ncbi:hypothetical protein WICMUC_004091 [Wickerhamomyces mucosus]|uniref:Glycoside hydrolase family 5 domain-containing protein n=1 Tax=Wickerhamomyces mucosus TaxID=1378264 RepID=A0A9P8PKB3_9ASCO|nr:hypothetical protein WICMUC_004091 [Wickerhamomyces mucosus]